MTKPQWAREKQLDPPNFGQAKLVTEEVLQKEVDKRRQKCVRIIQNSSNFGPFKKGLVSIVILSCKRLKALKRLCESLFPFLDNVETYRPFEAVLVDNGSGNELIRYAEGLGFFSKIVAFEKNLGMSGALRRVYPDVKGEYILFIEDDFVLDYGKPFINECIQIFQEYPEIGIIRLKNQNNWWKSYRRIGPIRLTSSSVEFWTWLPDKGRLPFTGGGLNVWTGGSVIFRKVSYMSCGNLPEGPNVGRQHFRVRKHQGELYELVYGKRYNRTWLAAKVKNCYPFFQPNDNGECPGWGER